MKARGSLVSRGAIAMGRFSAMAGINIIEGCNGTQPTAISEALHANALSSENREPKEAVNGWDK